MQTILGAGGSVSAPLAAALTAYTDQIRLVGRNPKKVNPGDELFPGDLLDRELTRQAVAGSEVVYLTAGLQYNIKVWEASWPVLMQNVIDACKEHGARLLFFDNVYSYGLVRGPMTEETPLNPCSRKGAVRKRLLEMIFREVEAGNLTAQIARAADFYGPKAPLSLMGSTVVDRLKAGKSAQWVGRPEKVHSFTFTLDAAKATALLGNTADAWNQSWHLPTAHPPLTGRQWVEHFAREFGVRPRIQPTPTWMVRLLGWTVVPILGEFVEMMYQFNEDYVFDSSKFEQRFGMQPTPYEEGIRQIAAAER